MPFESLVGVVEAFPWFGAAQKVLCERMRLMGGEELARDTYAAAALQTPSRKKILCLLRPSLRGTGNLRDCTMETAPNGKDEDNAPAQEIAEESMEEATEETFATTEPVTEEKQEDGANKNYRGAGDYFSREQYEQVRKEASEVSIPSETISDIDSFNFDRDVSLDGFCTEALAEIYAEQGYFERAKDIYAKLILAYPEKNTYFASLIEKMNEKN